MPEPPEGTPDSGHDVRRQYEQWVYPLPLADLDEVARRGEGELSDPSLLRRKFWPRAVEPANLRILSAGCGTSQAAWLAYRNPQCQVVGIDISQAALACQAALREKHRLANLELHALDLLEVERLNAPFDLIVCTGVLHHLPDPDAGLRKLKAVLAPQGVMSIMVYGWHARVGVYMMQEAFRLLGIEQTAEGIGVVRETLQALPGWHTARMYLETAPDLAYDAGLVDTFLHRQDRAYTVKQVLRLAADNGLQFQDWLDRRDYSLGDFLRSNPGFQQRAQRLKPEDIWQLVELLSQSRGTHDFLLCHPERDPGDYTPRFDAQDRTGQWLSYIPHLRPPISVVRPANRELQTPATLRRLAYEFTVDWQEAGMMQLVNGQRSIAEIVQTSLESPADDEQVRRRALRLFARMHDADHLMFELPRQRP